MRIEYTCKIAGRIVAVTAYHESTRKFCKKYLCGGEPDFAIAVTEADIAYEREKSVQEDYRTENPMRMRTDTYLETLAVQRKLAEKLFEYDTLLFHGSVVAVDGVGYLFTAKSGTGKSTHTRLWREVFGERAVMINDDKPFLRLTEAGVLACGSPWNGKHGLGSNACIPLRAICVLERGEKNCIRQISAKDAVFMLLQQSNRPTDKRHMGKYMELIDRLARNVLLFRMSCNMEHQAALIAYEAMSTEQ